MKRNDPGAPYISKKLDNALRQEWDAAGLLAENGPVKTLAVVGGIVNKADKLYREDHSHLQAIVRSLKEHGIPLDRNFSIDWYNLLPPMRNDFLHAAFCRDCDKPAVDAVAILYVPLHGESGWLDDVEPYGDDMNRRVMEDYYTTRKMIVASPWSERGIWPHAAFQSGARWVATWGGTYDEISAETFMAEGPENSFKLIQSSDPRRNSVGIVERAIETEPA